MTAQTKVLLALLRGCQPNYYDYGHPERAQARQYWTAIVPSHPDLTWANASPCTVYGYTHDECAMKWLRTMEAQDRYAAAPIQVGTRALQAGPATLT